MAAPTRKARDEHNDTHEQLREQEALRANKELAAYFKGRRTEREARAALKIIKAFLRHRERMDPAARHPLQTTAASRRRPERSATTKERTKPPQDVGDRATADAPVVEGRFRQGRSGDT